MIFGSARPEDTPLLAAIVESSDDAIVTTTLECAITSWNAGAERLYGYSAQEAIGCSITLIVPPERSDEPPALQQRLQQGERIRHFETVRVRKDGARLYVSVSISPIRDASGRIVATAAIARDITKRKRAEAEREQLLAREQAARVEAEVARKRLEFLAEATARLSASLDVEATVRAVAELLVPAVADWCLVDLVEPDGSLRRVAVAHPDPELARRLREMVPPQPTDPDNSHPHAMVLRTGAPVFVPEVSDETLRAMIADPRRLALARALAPHSGMAVPLLARGRTLGVLTFASAQSGRYGPADLDLAADLARRCALAIDNARLHAAELRAREEAEAAVRARDEFLSVAAHELKTPMTALLGRAQLLLRRVDRTGAVEPELLVGGLRAVERQSLKLARLVGQLLDVARIEAGRLVLERVPTELAALVRGVVAADQTATERHTLEVHAPEHLWAEVDPLRLEQVLTNLVDNAMKYSPEGGQIDVELAEQSPGWVRLAVRDRGPGIPEAALAEVFQRFFRADPRDHLGGMGLGLSISREIVERHGGRVWAESPPDGGARFVVLLPATAPPPPG